MLRVAVAVLGVLITSSSFAAETWVSSEEVVTMVLTCSDGMKKAGSARTELQRVQFCSCIADLWRREGVQPSSNEAVDRCSDAAAPTVKAQKPKR